MPRWFFPIPSLRAQSIGFFYFIFHLHGLRIVWNNAHNATDTTEGPQMCGAPCITHPPFPPSHCTMQPRTSPHQSNHLYCPCSPRPNTCPFHPSLPPTPFSFQSPPLLPPVTMTAALTVLLCSRLKDPLYPLVREWFD